MLYLIVVVKLACFIFLVGKIVGKIWKVQKELCK